MSMMINPYVFGASPPPATDPYWANVTCLMHLEGANGGTTFTDETGRTWAQGGASAPTLSTADQKFGTASLLGSGGSGRIQATAGAGMQFGTGDFTIECWYNPNSLTTFVYLASAGTSATTGWAVRVSSAGALQFLVAGVATQTFGSEATFTIGNWHHVAVTRSGTTIRGFIDGVLLSNPLTNSSSLLTDPTALCAIGDILGTSSINGYVDEYRVTKGIARYTADFTPPAAPFPNS